MCRICAIRELPPADSVLRFITSCYYLHHTFLLPVRILHTCHSVLYKQLSAWMLHGILLDEYEEFFITDKKIQRGREGRIKFVLFLFCFYYLFYFLV